MKFINKKDQIKFKNVQIEFFIEQIVNMESAILKINEDPNEEVTEKMLITISRRYVIDKILEPQLKIVKDELKELGHS